MKKLLITSLLLVLLLSAFAQETSLIKGKPHSTQGFLILKESPDIKYWHIDIVERDYSSGSPYTDIILERKDLIGKNYMKVPGEYLSESSYLLEISAFMVDGSIIEEELELGDPNIQFGGNPWELTNTWKCNGVDYAFEINQFSDNSLGVTNLQMDHTVLSYNNTTLVLTPYYQYFSESNYNNLITNLYGSWEINGIPYYDYYDVSPAQLSPDGVHVIKILNDPSITYKDRYGISINSSYVYGIQKGVGPWAPYNSCWGTPDFNLGSGGYNLQWGIDYINTLANPISCNKPTLECIPSPSSSGSSTGTGTGHSGLLEALTLTPTVWIWGTIEDWNNIFYGGNNGNWWDNYSSISITNLSGNNGQILNIKISDLIDEFGNITDISVNLNPGIYSVGINFSDGSYLPVIKEIKQTDNNTINDSDFLNVLLYPNPVLNDEFSMNISAAKDLNFTYQLNDFSGNIIYECDFSIQNNESEIISIEPDFEIPVGFLVNKFIFDDSSELNIITVKN